MERLAEETPLWYHRFTTYFLPGRRTVHDAYKLYQESRHQPVKSVPGSWRRAAVRYNWNQRAAEDDRVKLAEAQRLVEEARLLLMQAAVDAARLMIKLVHQGDRQAAQDVLDRSGVQADNSESAAGGGVTIIDFGS